MFEFIISASPESRHSHIQKDLALQGKAITLEDKTVCSRVGFRGVGAQAFLEAHSIKVPATPNQAITMESGLLVVRLSRTEFWLIDTNDQHTQSLMTLEQQALGLTDVYRLYCQHSHAVFQVKGEPSAHMFAKVCGVDLAHSVFARGSVAQTSVARVNAIVVNISVAESCSDQYLIFSDVSSSQYLWEALIDAKAEF